MNQSHRAALLLLLSACSDAESSDSLPSSGITANKQASELSEDEITQFCEFEGKLEARNALSPAQLCIIEHLATAPDESTCLARTRECDETTSPSPMFLCSLRGGLGGPIGEPPACEATVAELEACVHARVRSKDALLDLACGADTSKVRALLSPVACINVLERCQPAVGTPFRCDDGKKLSWVRLCDGRADCSGAEDEGYCTLDEVPFECDDGKRIAREASCDGKVDCADASDEGAFCSGADPCGHGFCCDDSSFGIPCDGKVDCEGGEDEAYCD